MTDKKLTDNELIEIIERCIKSNHNHEKCVRCYFEHNDCIKPHLGEVLDLIDRQKTEIERLNKEVDRLSQVVLYNDSVTEMKVEEAKAEAIKEYGSRVAQKLGFSF